jgi:hypothetical protein
MVRMVHRTAGWSPRAAVILASFVLVLFTACANSPTTTVAPSSVPTTAQANVTAPNTPTSAPATSTQSPSTPAVVSIPSPTVAPTTTPALTAKPLVLQPVKPLAQTEIVDAPLRDVRAVTDGTRPYRLAAWSPRGAFAAAVPQDGPGIDLIDLASGAVTPLVTTTYVLEPRWTEDGKLIIHQRTAQGDTLMLFDPERGWDDVPLIVSVPLSAPDAKGGRLAFRRGDALVICTAPCADEERTVPGGTLATAFAPGAASMLAWNPVVQSLEDVQTMIVSLADGTAMPQAVSAPGEGLWLPRWSPDGERLVLTSIEGRLVMTNLADGTRQDLGPGDAPSWSPDGTLIAYAGASAGLDYTTRNIHLVRADGTEERQRLTDAGEDQFFLSPSWSPDGRRILFVELDSGQLFVGTVPGR